MSKDQPVIIQIEEEDNYHTVADLVCFGMGLKIAHSANSVASAKELFTRIEKGEIKPDVAIVSSFLERDHNDGGHVAAKLKELAPKIKIIAYTVLEDVTWADSIAIKSGLDNTKTLINSLQDLTGAKYVNTNEA